MTVATQIIFTPSLLHQAISAALKTLSGGTITDTVSEIRMIDEDGNPMPIGRLVAVFREEMNELSLTPTKAPTFTGYGDFGLKKYKKGGIVKVHQKPKLTLIQGGKE